MVKLVGFDGNFIGLLQFWWIMIFDFENGGSGSMTLGDGNIELYDQFQKIVFWLLIWNVDLEEFEMLSVVQL